MRGYTTLVRSVILYVQTATKETIMFAKLTKVPHIDGSMKTVNFGDYVGFKQNIEMYGKVIAITGTMLLLEVNDGVTGEPVQYSEEAERCWAED
jgi:hypothetical protein